MGVLDTVLAYKQQRDAQKNADISAIPQAMMQFQAGRQQATDNLLKSLTLQATLAQTGLKIGQQGNQYSISQDPNSLAYQKNVQANQLTQAKIAEANAKTADLNNPNSSKNQSLQLRQDAADQKSWEKIVRNSDPSLASSRSTFGMASNGNLRADRALSTLQNNKILTNQDAQNIVADIAGIYAGGAPSDQGMKHSQYESIQQKVAGLQQYIQGKPTDALPPAIKDHLTQVISDLKSVNNEAIKGHFNYQETANKNVISKFQDEWNQMKQVYVPDSGNSNSNSSEIAVGSTRPIKGGGTAIFDGKGWKKQ